MKYARKCSISGEGMNEGWLQGDGEQYFKYEKDVIAWLREVEFDVLYWTVWEDESEHQYEEINGILIEIQ
jgi:hypothetical protein